MKFKIGDKVRFTREYMRNNWYAIFDAHEPIITGSKIDSIEGQKCIIDCKDRPEEALELVPEEPEFEYGEEIEVSDTGTERGRRIFLHKVLGNAYSPYICTDGNNLDIFKNGDGFYTNSWKYARKLKPQLTRKEIAEKFGVSEDFTLID